MWETLGAASCWLTAITWRCPARKPCDAALLSSPSHSGGDQSGRLSHLLKVTQQRERGHRRRRWMSSRAISTPRLGQPGVYVWSWQVVGFPLLEREEPHPFREAAGALLPWLGRVPVGPPEKQCLSIISRYAGAALFCLSEHFGTISSKSSRQPQRSRRAVLRRSLMLIPQAEKPSAF